MWLPLWLLIQGAGRAIELSAVIWLWLSLSVSRKKPIYSCRVWDVGTDP